MKPTRRKTTNPRNGPVVLIGLAIVSVAMFFFIEPRVAAESEIFTDKDNVAILGYDTVAYFTQKKAVEGSNQFTHRWKDAIWHFASAENRNLFADNPEKYAPQFGGY